MIEDLLKKLGFSDKEIQVYLMVLRSGKITPADIARATHINRSTVYSVAKDLIKRGVISEDLGSKHRYLVAISPIVLEQLAQKEEKKLNEKKKTISQVVDELLTVTRNAQYSIPKIHFVSEEDVESYLYSQSKVWNASVQEVDETATWWGFQDKYLIDNYEGWIDWFWENSISHNVSLKLLSNESAEDIKKKKFPRREIRFWEASEDFTATTWILGNYVVMIVAQEHPHYLVEIHDAVLSRNLREVFKGIWKSLD